MRRAAARSCHALSPACRPVALVDRPGIPPTVRSSDLSKETVAVLPTTSVSDMPLLVLEPSKGFVRPNLGDVWVYRELLCFLIWRDIKVRYKQTALGAAWAILQPVMTMLVFSVFFGHFAR